MGVYYPQSSVLIRVRWERQKENSNDTFEEISVLPIRCKHVKVNINDYTQADTFSLEIDYKNFPFDPRCIRGVGVNIAMQNMKRIFNDDNSLSYVAITKDGPNRNEIFTGFADEEKISFDDSKRTVSLEGRDFTALLIDKKYVKGAIGLEKKVDEVLTDILATSPDLKDIKLDNQIKRELPVLAKFWGEKDLLSGKRNSVKDETYWDVIQDVVRRAGLIAYIELENLVISEPRNIYDKNKAKKFVYGRNLKSLEYSRKIGRRRGFNILVRSLNLNTKEIIEAKIPAEATAAWSEATGISNTEVKIKKIRPDGTANPKTKLDANGKPTVSGAKPSTGLVESEETAPYMSFLIADVVDKDHLIACGEQFYEEVGRQEIEGSLTTREMSTADGDNTEFNLLHMRNGTPIQIFVEQGDMAILSNFRAKFAKDNLKDRHFDEDQAENVANYLISRGWPEPVATIFANRFNDFSNLFYTRAVEFTLDSDTGFSCKIDFVNFIETKPGGHRAGQ